MTWKYEARLKKRKYYQQKCSVQIYSDDWELYNQLVKAIKTVINDGDIDD